MTKYLDTSVLVSALTHEAASAGTRAWFDRQETGDLVISDWVVTEFSAALSIKLRTGAIVADQFALGLRAADALHLAVVLDHGAVMCTLDRRLADAG